MRTTEAFRLDGARAPVTGASRGIGRAVALAPADAGVDRALSARTEEALKDTALEVAQRHRAAHLVLMSSVAGVIGTPMMEAYAATKAGRTSLARSLAVGWARDGVRVNARCPGWTRTDMTAFAQRSAPVSDWLTAHAPLGRRAEPEEAAWAALHLASPAAGCLTGQALVVDGGLSVPDSGLAGIPEPSSPSAGV
ncbi:SDR family NAD(P)-dependent oxidoreductase [Streptomyces sp. YGL11-2]|uniref:SDR family NAD(P)-dependent oxidoreductase n=1 Tax=Streptomyces sp. YGL11-2 TaxID=3414028 RepID=UPI003CFBC074